MKIILDAIIDNLPEGVLAIPNYQNYLLNILVNVGYELDTAPVGDLLKRMHGLDGEWAVVSPVNWQATHNDSMLVAAGHDFSLSSQQSIFLFEKFAEFVSDEGMQLFMHDAVTWLLKVKDKPLLNARPVYSILHHSLITELERLDASLYWQKFITMSQMLFSNLQLPGAKNLYPVNGVWVWGAGRLLDNNTSQIIALDEKSLAIAKILNGCEYSSNNVIPKDAIFLASSSDIVGTRPNLQVLPNKYLQKINYWYWNNSAYKLQSRWNIFKAIICRLNKKN